MHDCFVDKPKLGAVLPTIFIIFVCIVIILMLPCMLFPLKHNSVLLVQVLPSSSVQSSITIAITTYGTPSPPIIFVLSYFYHYHCYHHILTHSQFPLVESLHIQIPLYKLVIAIRFFSCFTTQHTQLPFIILIKHFPFMFIHFRHP